MEQAISVADAVAKIPEGAVIMFRGFMGVGRPERLMDGLVRQKRGGPTVIGVGKLVDAGLVARMIVSHFGIDPVTRRRHARGRGQADRRPGRNLPGRRDPARRRGDSRRAARLSHRKGAA